jgi:hypothetical protein
MTVPDHDASPQGHQIMSGDYTHGGALPEVITYLNCIEISLLLPARADVRNQVRT